MSEKRSAFERLNAIDVSRYVERRNGMTYLPWAKALELLRREFPDSTFAFHRFGGGELLYSPSPAGAFVETEVTVDGLTLPMVLPVLDHAHKPVAEPNSFQINAALMRCLTKNIAAHGLGLSVYVGEDLPTDSKARTQAPSPAPPTHQSATSTGVAAAFPGAREVKAQPKGANGNGGDPAKQKIDTATTKEILGRAELVYGAGDPAKVQLREDLKARYGKRMVRDLTAGEAQDYMQFLATGGAYAGVEKAGA